LLGRSGHEAIWTGPIAGQIVVTIASVGAIEEGGRGAQCGRFRRPPSAGSINRKVANALIELAPSPLKVEIAEIGQLALYNQDQDDSPPSLWSATFHPTAGRC
jgi:hypothetical protein